MVVIIILLIIVVMMMAATIIVVMGIVIIIPTSLMVVVEVMVVAVVVVMATVCVVIVRWAAVCVVVVSVGMMRWWWCCRGEWKILREVWVDHSVVIWCVICCIKGVKIIGRAIILIWVDIHCLAFWKVVSILLCWWRRQQKWFGELFRRFVDSCWYMWCI